MFTKKQIKRSHFYIDNNRVRPHPMRSTKNHLRLTSQAKGGPNKYSCREPSIQLWPSTNENGQTPLTTTSEQNGGSLMNIYSPPKITFLRKPNTATCQHILVQNNAHKISHWTSTLIEKTCSSYKRLQKTSNGQNKATYYKQGKTMLFQELE